LSDDVHIELRSIVFDCEDAVTLARFYQTLLGGELSTSDPHWCEVRLASKGFKLAFQLIENYRAPEWPDGLPQQMHLDLTVTDMEAASARAVELGARRIRDPVLEEGAAYTVHLDPAGHPFCLCQEGFVAPGR
jgi:predicted enzyme related to lactoylglutathione lyase